ncbi:MAG: CotH kinase family protein [Bacteroidales bacterium]
MKKINKYLLISIIGISTSSLVLHSCDSEDAIESTTEETVDNEDYSDWTEATHSKNVDPNYDEVFDDSSVMKLEIVIDSDKWEDMQENLEDIFGSTNPGMGGNFGGPMPGMGGGGQGMTDGFIQDVSYDDPDWVDCSLYYNDIEWYHVGIRYKGNSSLQRAYQSGSSKLSFKLDFDQYEDDYPDLKNQRFYGFKQLNLNNNFDDASLMREKVTADLFRSFGVPAPHTRFCIVYVNHGDGNEFYGVYTLVEEVDDTVIDTQFDDNDGNLYKPEGDAASFAEGTYDEDEFMKKTNEDDADYSDVLSLYNAINDTETLNDDPDTWRSNLEKTLNVSEFIKWLAANTVIQNWDTYGNMTHNYYLYNDLTTGLLNWIPWDNNEALIDDDRSIELSLSDVSDDWPLIYNIMKIDEYKDEYKADLKSFVEDVYTSTTMNSLYDTYNSLIEDYASEEGVSGYSSAVTYLRSHVSQRATAVANYLDN